MGIDDINLFVNPFVYELSFFLNIFHFYLSLIKHFQTY